MNDIFKELDPPPGGWEQLQKKINNSNGIKKIKSFDFFYKWGRLAFLGFVLILLVFKQPIGSSRFLYSSQKNDFPKKTASLLSKLQKRNPLGLMTLGILPESWESEPPISFISNEKYPYLFEKIKLNTDSVIFYRIATLQFFVKQ